MSIAFYIEKVAHAVSQVLCIKPFYFPWNGTQKDRQFLPRPPSEPVKFFFSSRASLQITRSLGRSQALPNTVARFRAFPRVVVLFLRKLLTSCAKSLFQ